MDNKRRKQYFKMINQNLKGKRVLEIGPRDGFDTMRIDSLNPSDIVLVELPSKVDNVDEWIEKIKSKTTVIYDNLMYMDEVSLKTLGKFDLIYFAGILYHNPEQLRFLRKIYKLLNVNGQMLLETATIRDPTLVDKNVVEIHYPDRYRGTTTITHLPSIKCIRSWMDMVGFKNIMEYKPDIYNKNGRYVCVANKVNEDDGAYYYSEFEDNKFIFGDSK